MKLEQCFEILKEKIDYANNENDYSFDLSIEGVETKEVKLVKGLTRREYILEDGIIFMFLKYEESDLESNEKAVPRTITMYAKNSSSDEDILKHGSMNENFSFEKVLS